MHLDNIHIFNYFDSIKESKLCCAMENLSTFRAMVSKMPFMIMYYLYSSIGVPGSVISLRGPYPEKLTIKNPEKFMT